MTTKNDSPAHEAIVDGLTLTESESEVVAELADDLVPHFLGGESPVSPGLLDAATRRLPPRVSGWLQARGARRSSHALVIRNCPVRPAELGATPLHWVDAETTSSQFHACVLLLLARPLGRAFGWKSQQNGRVVTDVVPSPGLEESLVSSSSRAELGWHSEDAFSDDRADFVALSCLRAAEGGATTVSFIEGKQLTDEVLQTLTEPRFVIAADDAHDLASTATPLVPLVKGGNPYQIRVDRDFTSAAEGDTDAALALETLFEAIDQNVQDLALVPGDVAFIDNTLAVHGRRSFTPRFDGTDRWLKRVNIRAHN